VPLPLLEQTCARMWAALRSSAGHHGSEEVTVAQPITSFVPVGNNELCLLQH